MTSQTPQEDRPGKPGRPKIGQYLGVNTHRIVEAELERIVNEAADVPQIELDPEGRGMLVDITRMKFGVLLAVLRQLRGCSQKNICDALGCTQSQLSKMETSDGTPSDADLGVFARVLNIDEGSLIAAAATWRKARKA
jgi:hypothetical protein